MKLKNFIGNFIDAVTSFYFNQLEGEVVQFIKDNKKDGLDDLGYCDLKLSETKDDDFDALIRAYYRTNREDKFIEKKKMITFNDLKNIPRNVSKVISEKGSITIKIEDIVDLLSEEIGNVKDPLTFDDLTNKLDRKFKEFDVDQQKFESKLIIEDRVFYKKIYFVFEPIQKTGIKGEKYVAYYSDITDLPIDISDKLNNEGKIEMTFE